MSAGTWFSVFLAVGIWCIYVAVVCFPLWKAVKAGKPEMACQCMKGVPLPERVRSKIIMRALENEAKRDLMAARRSVVELLSNLPDLKLIVTDVEKRNEK